MLTDFSSKKILVVDDFSDFRRAVKRMLESFGAKDITEASTGEEAVNSILRKAYDIIICDYNLGYGKKDGQQVLEEAKHRGLLKYSCVFIMVTAENTMTMVMGAFEYQPDDYLVKPITKEILKARIEKILKKKSDFEEIEKAIQKKDYLRAIALCDQRISINPKNALEYLKLKGELYISLGSYKEARAIYEQVLAMRDIPWAKLGLGKVHFLSGAFLEAKEIFESLVKENRTFMEAYDWLSKTLEELGALEESQRILSLAVEISPKSILRQKAIADISLKNQDYPTAEKSYKEAIKLGKHSYLKSPANYTGLAKVFVEKKTPTQALTIIDEVRSEFKNSPVAILQAAVAEGMVYKKMNREKDAQKSLSEATKLFESLPGNVPTEIVLELAKASYELGEKEKATKLMQDVIRNHYENPKIIKKVENLFKEVELQEEGQKIISSSREEVIQINNQGVRLVEEGKLSEAIDYFEKAAKGLPENKIINANAAQALIMYIQKNGKDDRFLFRAGQYLEKVRNIDPSYEKYQKLLSFYEYYTGSSKI